MLVVMARLRKTAGGHLPYSDLECNCGNVPGRGTPPSCANGCMDRIQAVRLFIRVVDLGSFSKAAAEMGVGQPAATKQVAQLERGLGARLLHRSTHGVTPTEIGLLYYDKCKLIAHHVDEAESVATLMQTQLQGALRVSSSVAFGRRVLVPLVLRFMQLNPGLRIELSFEDRYVDLVAQGIDVSIRMGRLADSSLGLRFLGVNPWVVVAAPAYLKARGVPKRPADLAEHDALIYSSVQGDARWLFTNAKGKSQSMAVHGPLQSNNLSALLAAARHGLGIAALPRYVAQASLASGAVQPLLVDWLLPAQEIHAVFPSPRLLPAKVRGFIDWLQPQLADAWWTMLD
jgi:DNA-binding transcriptional LysR family regulator